VKEGLQEAVDKATENAFKEATKDLRVYCIIDKSGSMQGALERAQEYLTKFLGGFPLDRLHVSVFNTVGTEITIQAPKAAAVKQAFRGHNAGGGTSYAEGVRALQKHKPTEGEDALMLFVGDEEDGAHDHLAQVIRQSDINPVAFGLLKVQSNTQGRGSIVVDTANLLGIPCFRIDEKMFTADDPYAITRLMRELISATPVIGTRTGRISTRKNLIQEIMETALLQKPVWA
jgi:hypothetical protein